MTVPSTIAEAATQIRDGTLSPVALTRHCLDRIDAADDRIGAFITVNRDQALADAERAETEIERQGPCGPLHGIPFGLKDLFDVPGLRTTGHSRQCSRRPAVTGSAVWKRLQRAGAVLLGKQALHEYALGGPSWDVLQPPARNPWDLGRFSGGSSSGTAAAVATGMGLFGIGSDTSGSIRSPAAFCGITGLKPTYGRVAKSGALPLAGSMDHAGPLARTAEDCALVLQAIAGPDPDDPVSAPQPVPDYLSGIGAGVSGLRIGVLRQFFLEDAPVSDAQQSALEQAVAVLRGLGAVIGTARLSPLGDWAACGTIILLSEAYAGHEAGLKTSPELYGTRFRELVSLGSLLSAADYLHAMRRRRQLVREVSRGWSDFDLLLTASQYGEAPPVEDVSAWGLVEVPSHSMPFSLCGIPAVSLPIGLGPGGLPLGMQMAAPPFAEALLLRAAHAFQQATAWHRLRPPELPPRLSKEATHAAVN